MKIKVSKIVPRGFSGITLWPFGIYFSHERYLTNQRIINHEKIHWRQQQEMLGIFFYLWYGIEYLIRRLKLDANSAYRRLYFEREAYNNQYNQDYLKTRKRFAWIKYCFV